MFPAKLFLINRRISIHLKMVKNYKRLRKLFLWRCLLNFYFYLVKIFGTFPLLCIKSTFFSNKITLNIISTIHFFKTTIYGINNKTNHFNFFSLNNIMPCAKTVKDCFPYLGFGTILGFSKEHYQWFVS